MKRKIFSILFALVLVASFSLVTAVPVAAAEPTLTPNLISVGNGGADWSTGQLKPGSEPYSVLLDAGDVGDTGDGGVVKVFVDPIAIASFTGASYFVWEPPLTEHGGEFPYATAHPYGDPYINIYLDTDGDGIYDDYLEGLGSVAVPASVTPPETHPTPTAETWVQMEEGYGFYDGDNSLLQGTWISAHVVGTLAEWKTYLETTYPLTNVVGVQIVFGLWADEVTPDVYIEDVEVSGTTYDLEPAVINTDTDEGFNTIQAAIDDPETAATHTITVAAGEYAGAIVDKAVKIIGAAGGTSVITSGPHYGGSSAGLLTAFRLDESADGAEIRNFTISCDRAVHPKFYFAVFARGADNVIVDSLTVNHPIQGISNWGGSNWEITHNVIDNTEAAGGGGIAIYLGALPGVYPTCSNNLVQYNRIIGDGATATTYTCPGISLCLDARGADVEALNTEELTGNQILDNTIRVTNVTGGVGIEVGVIGLDTNAKIDGVMTKAPIHDNTVKGNTIDGPWQGMLLYNLTDLTVGENEITNCCGEGIVVAKGHSGVAINYNSIYGNGTDIGTVYSGVYNDDIVEDGDPFEVDYGSIDATNNWWGGVAGPQHSTNPYNDEAFDQGNDSVSNKVDFLPWMIHTKLQEGWNIYSTPIAPDASSDTIDEALNLWGSGEKEIAYYYNGETQYWDEPTSLTPLQAVYIKMAAAATIDVVVSSEATFPPSTDMHVGWNLVGPAELGKRPVDIALLDAYLGTGVATALQGYSKALSPPLYQSNWTYLRDGVTTDKYFVPTEGYWVLMVNQGILGGVTTTPIYYEAP